MRVAQAHCSGKENYARSVAFSLFEDFLLVEERFAANKDATEQEVIDSLRKVSRTFSEVEACCASHSNSQRISEVNVILLFTIKARRPAA